MSRTTPSRRGGPATRAGWRPTPDQRGRHVAWPGRVRPADHRLPAPPCPVIEPRLASHRSPANPRPRLRVGADTESQQGIARCNNSEKRQCSVAASPPDEIDSKNARPRAPKDHPGRDGIIRTRRLLDRPHPIRGAFRCAGAYQSGNSRSKSSEPTPERALHSALWSLSPTAVQGLGPFVVARHRQRPGGRSALAVRAGEREGRGEDPLPTSGIGYLCTVVHHRKGSVDQFTVEVPLRCGIEEQAVLRELRCGWLPGPPGNPALSRLPVVVRRDLEDVDLGLRNEDMRLITGVKRFQTLTKALQSMAPVPRANPVARSCWIAVRLERHHVLAALRYPHRPVGGVQSPDVTRTTS